MLEKQIIQESSSPYNSPLWVIPKKLDASGKKKWRIVVDFRKINELTKQDAYPIPNIDEILEQLGKARYFSAFDLASGFHQIPLTKESQERTAFSTNQGHFEYLRMPFGLKNAPATFQRMMDRALRGLIGSACFAYLDDVVIYGSTLEQHNENLERVLQRLRDVKLKLQPDKCEYLKPNLQYLGHLITPEGVKPNPEKCKAVKEFPEPRNAKQIKQFLGLAGYYRKFVKDFSKIAKPLNNLLIKNAKFEFGKEQRDSFERLKNELCSNKILKYPDFQQDFILTTDASNEAVGAILSQGQIGKDLPCSYASRTLNSAERNYSTTEKELLAIVWSVKHFRPYLLGRKFKIVTDHQPLQWLMKNRDPSSRLMRWRITLEEYDYEIVYKKGKLNANADALSRNPVLKVETLVRNIKITDEPMPKATIDDKIVFYEIDNTVKDYEEYYIQEEFTIVLKVRSGAIVLPYGGGNTHVYLRQLEQVAGNNREKTIKTIRDTFKGNTGGTIYIHDTELVIPNKDDVNRILKENHDSLVGGHRGVHKTYFRIINQYYWKGIYQDVKNYVGKCEICQRTKANRKPTKMPMVITDTPSKFNEKVAMDIVGPLKETSRGNKYILTLQCLLTKYCWAWPLPSYTSEHCAEAFLKYYICYYGTPKTILTDNGQNFTSKFMTEFEKRLGIRHVKTTAIHPESNGSLERSHQMLKDYLKSYCNKQQNKWDDFVDLPIYNYNTSIHESTGYMPYELVFGSPPNPISTHATEFKRTYDDHIKELGQHLGRMRNNAREALISAEKASKERYDRYARPNVYKPGDMVWLKREKRDKNTGLNVPFEGPYEVLDVPSDVDILINVKGKHVLVHGNRCKFANINMLQENDVLDNDDPTPGPSCS